VVLFRFSYRELVSKFEGDNAVYVLDDGVILNQNEFVFSSISSVAAECLTCVSKIVAASKTREVCLGGWSYGGVVASEIAVLLAKSDSNLSVKMILLFDSPLRPVLPSLRGASNTSANDFLSFQSGDDKSLEQLARNHFCMCTKLLHLFHGRQASVPVLNCPIWDIRPEDNIYDCGSDAVQELTEASFHRVIVKGTHWNMLFGANAGDVAKLIKDAISESV
jgi:thioesterase domain-containing protein